MADSSPECERPFDVLVAQGWDYFGQARLPHLLSAAGMRVSVIAQRGSFLAATRFADFVLPVDGDVDAINAALRDHLSDRPKPYDWVILLDDAVLWYVLEHADEEWAKPHLPVDPAAARIFRDKLEFLRFARAAGIPLAPSREVDSLAGARRAAAALGYPVMIKLPTGTGGRGVRKIDSADQLEREYPAFAGDMRVTVEKYIDGEVGGSEILFKHGEVLCSWSFYKERCWPGPYGPSSRRVAVSFPEIDRVIARLGALTGFHGLGTVCWIRDPADGAAYVLEFNAAPGTGMELSIGLHNKFMAALRAFAHGAPFHDHPTDVGRRLRLFPEELCRQLEEAHGWTRVPRILYAIAASNVPWDEPRLLRAHLAELLSRSETARRVYRRLRHAVKARATT
jgi:hypothetical protein